MRSHWIVAAFVVLGCANGEETRTFELRHLEPEAAATLIEPYLPDGLLAVQQTAEPRAVTVTGPAARVEQVAEVLQTYDRPQPNVTLRFQLIEADGFTESDPAIVDVTDALRSLFRFEGYRLAGEAVVRARPFSHISQRLATADQTYEIAGRIDRIVVSDERSAVDLTVELGAIDGSLIRTAMTLPGGQTAVVGSARAQSQGRTLILVVRSEIR